MYIYDIDINGWDDAKLLESRNSVAAGQTQTSPPKQADKRLSWLLLLRERFKFPVRYSNTFNSPFQGADVYPCVSISSLVGAVQIVLYSASPWLRADCSWALRSAVKASLNV